MSRVLKLISITLFASVLIAGPIYAITKANDYVTVRADEVIDDDLYVAGQEVTIEGVVNGDVYAAAERINVTGTVNGDVIGIAQNIDVSGVVRDDVRVAGETINITGAEIGDSLTAASSSLTIDRESSVGGGLAYGGENLTIAGSIGRGVVSGSETTRVDGPVGRSVEVSASNVVIDESAVIQGNLNYDSAQEADIKGQVLGSITRQERDMKSDGLLQSFVLWYNLWAYAGALIVALAMLLLFPMIFKKAHKNLMDKPTGVLGRGALFLLALLPLSGILAATIIGIPLALVSIMLWLLAIYFAKFFVGYSLGHTLLSKVRKQKDKKTATYAAIVVGLSLYYLLRMIPTFGTLVRFLTTIAGIGMMLSLYNRPAKAKSKK
ncbi:MAG: hypothetical protein AAF413_02395 [Patescibacteria group bacterium]